MAVPNAVAGAYTCTYNGLACGQTEQGFRLSHSFFKRIITGDAMAQTPQDAVYQGAEMNLAMNLIEFKAAAAYTIMWPYGAYLQTGVVGRLDGVSGLTKQIVLTAVAGTPASAAPASMTFPETILSEGFPVELLLAPDLRIVPLRMRIYPYSATNQYDGSAIFGIKT